MTARLPFAAPLLATLLFSSLPTMAQEPPPVPDTLKVPTGYTLKFAARAQGFQIYQCTQDKADPKAYAWVLSGPQADLFEAQGNKLGSHCGGPTWEGKDGSKALGAVKANDKSPDPKAIAWLRLDAKPAGSNGVMSSIKYVQRLQTNGGKAPEDGCKAATTGTSVNIPYTAQYYFYEAAQ